MKENKMTHRIATLTCVCLIAFFPLVTRAQDAKPDDEGFIRDWLMLAPFSIGDSAAPDELDKKQIPDEGAIKPKAGDKQKIEGKEQTWKAVKAKDYYLDLNQTLGGGNENVLAYLVAYVVCDKEMADLTLWIGSNDEAKVYLNGKEVVKFTETRVIEKDGDKADHVTLNKGVNVIVFKVINEMNDWAACARFKDKDGKAVTAFTVKTSP
jgi:hypothetical protein